MGVELRPLGVKCNIQCQYCYQDPQRDAGNVMHRYDIEQMKRSLLAYNQPFTMFGGEPLLVPINDLRELFEFGLTHFKNNSIQTNGSLINDDHIALFKAYKVHVGISIDGPGELNDARWCGSLKQTRLMTQRSEQAIEKLCNEGIAPSLIITLHRNNATADKLSIMQDWFVKLESMGVRSARLHILEVDNPQVRDKYALSAQENIDAFLSFAEFEQQLTHLRFDLFNEMRNLLLGKDKSTTCVWNACDPYTTRAVQGIEGNGQRSNCGRTNKDGIDFTKSASQGFERSMALYLTPFQHGGCKDCRFFLMCKGQCPGTAIDGDWRNRTEQCEEWFKLFSHLEQQLIKQGQKPLSLQPQLKNIESTLFHVWMKGENASVADIIENPNYLKQLDANQINGEHGDIPHGDSHGDHSDTSLS